VLSNLQGVHTLPRVSMGFGKGRATTWLMYDTYEAAGVLVDNKSSIRSGS
jgi:hypothetical protein